MATPAPDPRLFPALRYRITRRQSGTVPTTLPADYFEPRHTVAPVWGLAYLYYADLFAACPRGLAKEFSRAELMEKLGRDHLSVRDRIRWLRTTHREHSAYYGPLTKELLRKDIGRLVEEQQAALGWLFEQENVLVEALVDGAWSPASYWARPTLRGRRRLTELSPRQKATALRARGLRLQGKTWAYVSSACDGTHRKTLLRWIGLLDKGAN